MVTSSNKEFLLPRVPLTVICLLFLSSLALFLGRWILKELEVAPSLVLRWWFCQWAQCSVQSKLLKQHLLHQTTAPLLVLPEIDVHNFTGDSILTAVESKYGKNWRSKPLLLRNIWTETELNDTHRRLSLQGLLQEKLPIPYFTDARKEGALTPDAEAPLGEIVYNISKKGMPHKIGTQLLAQEHPELVYEVAPNEIVTSLFGNYFTPNMIRGNGLLPPLTVIPLFIAKATPKAETEDDAPGSTKDADTCTTPDDDDKSCRQQQQQQVPRTDLHCEPIANILVQLSGSKRVTLISPEHSFALQPTTSPDGRAYIYSQSSVLTHHVPRYSHVIEKGDAVYIPTWTWHKVEYSSTSDVAISGSLFHFRLYDFWVRNPLFATVILPNLVYELTGAKMQ